jgi:hypothetical protein
VRKIDFVVSVTLHEQLKVKIRCTLVQALRLCTGCMAHRGSRGIALPFVDHGTRRGWGVSVTPQPLFTPGKDLYPLYRWAPGPILTGAENLAPTMIQSPDRPARSQLLYRLHYPAHIRAVNLMIIYNEILSIEDTFSLDWTVIKYFQSGHYEYVLRQTVFVADMSLSSSKENMYTLTRISIHALQDKKYYSW